MNTYSANVVKIAPPIAQMLLNLQRCTEDWNNANSFERNIFGFINAQGSVRHGIYHVYEYK